MWFEDLEQKLKNKNINPSHQRLKILDYLDKNRCHPTVEEIYSDLHAQMLTLSKTTVYNTLKRLIEEDLVRVITIEDNEARYDINTEDHGHFKCEDCKEIFDFDVDFNKLSIRELEGFKVSDKNMYFKGICLKCLKG